MKQFKWILGLAAFGLLVLAIFFVLQSEKALVVHPKGIVARGELHLIGIHYALMLLIVIPTAGFLFYVVWKYRAGNKGAKHEPEWSGKRYTEFALWMIPVALMSLLSLVAVYGAFEHDPYRPLKGDRKLTIEVVALDWKWLFIYPDQGIAAVNYVQFPEKTAVHFKLAADGSPMNSFWIPQLSGQIYAMTGMVTPLHVAADGVGVYSGRAAEINGDGFADMLFTAESTADADFEKWVASVKGSPLQLTESVYEELLKPSQNHPVVLYSSVANDLFHHIVMKYMHP